ncbi:MULTISPECIES: (2Fe-2S)-binding protein [Streptomyces]|uniref:(2Fe-2S)-binding protein n=1 Tax=Streptomyces caniscabiei TaxID=2746961 RepID=A0ABU4N458_9ACTN|nr:MULTISPECIES: (2Fe-2S)-binding protein [Streptomyces]MBE4741407.1 (2Fe-2S)-binding protein [Streptomyces caniscabiei]MBE4761440.1 (2Fe-2S)-binding protein [Streptomyces caniscabiei]MBE4769567.1 (2Fe-2S)-binding protein [Streptomyces caniscabiei]MBE4789891.1 (2Fe-2S)-binding protein [Streptomyces caniscabiei]MBE4799089.1 (2Fe-2S)-binding protein [Streptomyces caniscabiei]
MTVAHLETAQADTATSVPVLLSAAYRRLDATCEALSVRIGGPGRSADGSAGRTVGLTDGQEDVEAFVEAEAARIRERHDHTAPRHVAASRALHDYAWSVSLLMSGVWYLERRVPRIAPGDIRIDLASGAFEVAPGTDLVCLPDDPAALLPGTRTVAHPEALRAELRAAVADHMGPVLEAMGPYARRGSRALWGLVSDDLVSGLWYLGRTRGDEAAGVRAASAVLPSAHAPFPGGADFRSLRTDDGREHPTRTRMGCCLYYTIRPAEACSTCPRTCDAERLRRLEG